MIFKSKLKKTVIRRFFCHSTIMIYWKKKAHIIVFHLKTTTKLSRIMQIHDKFSFLAPNLLDFSNFRALVKTKKKYTKKLWPRRNSIMRKKCLRTYKKIYLDCRFTIVLLVKFSLGSYWQPLKLLNRKRRCWAWKIVLD